MGGASVCPENQRMLWVRKPPHPPASPAPLHPALTFSRTLGAIHVPCLQAPEEEAHRPLPSGRLLRQAAQGRGVDTQLKLPHFEFRNCGERVSSVGSWGKRREGSALLIGTSGAPGIPPGEGGDGARTVLRIPGTEAPPPLLSLEPEALRPACAGSRAERAHRQFPGLQPSDSGGEGRAGGPGICVFSEPPLFLPSW